MKKKKHWDEMTTEEQIKTYEVAIDSGDVRDSFRGFSLMMSGSERHPSAIFNVETGEILGFSKRVLKGGRK